MRNVFRRKRTTNITDVDINRNEGVLYFVREYSNIINEDRTVAVYVSRESAEKAVRAIRKHKDISRGKNFRIEEFNFIEHKNSLVGK